MVHPWVAKRRKGARTKAKEKRAKAEEKEAVVLEVVEERVERKEIKLVEEGTRSVRRAENELAHSGVDFVSFHSEGDLKIFREWLGAAETKIANVRNYSKKAIALARRLEADLLDIRNADPENRTEALSEDEMRVITFAIRINENITELAAQIRSLRNTKLEPLIRPPGGSQEAASRNLLASLRLINNGLASLHKHLVELFALEKTVEELTKEYVESAAA
ncbi:hypothetical protein KY360_03500 [Candidatus Woesearchaeota archaeon]|nr:hypothetical protein [Candidatus Woesearchaeota archaeon]